MKNIRNLRKNEIDSNLRTAGSKDRKKKFAIVKNNSNNEQNLKSSL